MVSGENKAVDEWVESFDVQCIIIGLEASNVGCLVSMLHTFPALTWMLAIRMLDIRMPRLYCLVILYKGLVTTLKSVLCT